MTHEPSVTNFTKTASSDTFFDAGAAARGEPETRDPGVPVEDGAVRLHVHGCEPECAVVDGIDRHGAVVPPAAAAGCRLRAAALDDAPLVLQSTQWVTWGAGGIANRRVNVAAGGAVAHGHVTGLIHRDAAHPAKHAVGHVCPLLRDNGSVVVRILQLVPAHAHAAAGGNGVVHDKGLMIPEVAVRQAEH